MSVAIYQDLIKYCIVFGVDINTKTLNVLVIHRYLESEENCPIFNNDMVFLNNKKAIVNLSNENSQWLLYIRLYVIIPLCVVA